MEFLLALICAVFIGYYTGRNQPWLRNSLTRFWNRRNRWNRRIREVEYFSTRDGKPQKAMAYCSARRDRPLLVSLHAWSDEYRDYDPLSEWALRYDWNYIHPDFRGPNNHTLACCSDFVMHDIDDAIDFMLHRARANRRQVFVTGCGGGGMAALGSFMKSRHVIRKYTVVNPITDLIAWHEQCTVRRNGFAEQILQCTHSQNELNIESARARSPLYWTTPPNKLQQTELEILCGVYDGIAGEVPFTHGIHYYHKLLNDQGAQDNALYVRNDELLDLFQFKPQPFMPEHFGRKLFLQKTSGRVKLTVYEGDHEPVHEWVFHSFLQCLEAAQPAETERVPETVKDPLLREARQNNN